ncbi:hypothetical protein FJW08_16455 [Mesorhizobium sp. B3-2-1]|nr:hypothetical protein FJW08_16455 [Mesorhizobium sp. B3-2-1]
MFGAVVGEPGVAKVLDILLDEVATDLRLCGLPCFEQVGPGLIA